MTAVFLSYSRLNRSIVAPLTSLLRGLGIDVFRDEESIVPGDDWKCAIDEAIRSCDTVLIFWSAAAADSKFVEQEHRLAVALQKRIIPILLDDTPLASDLAAYQWADLREILKGATVRSMAVAASAAAIPGATVGWIPFTMTALLAVNASILGVAFAGSKSPTIGFTESEEAAITDRLTRALQPVSTSDVR